MPGRRASKKCANGGISRTATTIDEISAEMNQVAEGVKTSRVVMELGAKYDVDLPISREVYGVLYEARTARDAYRGLTRRDPGAEHEPD